MFRVIFGVCVVRVDQAIDGVSEYHCYVIYFFECWFWVDVVVDFGLW